MKLEAEDITLSGNVSIVGNLTQTIQSDLTLPINDSTNINTYTPPGAVPGTIVFNTVWNKVYVWTGTHWISLN